MEAEPIAWWLEFRIRPDHGDAFTELVEDMVASARAEPDALNFEWFIDDDGQTGRVYERYGNERATLAHLQSFGSRFADRFMTATEPVQFTVLGNPPDAVKDALSGFGPRYLRPFVGFAR
jgi:quinol monooxygenase YgiN